MTNRFTVVGSPIQHSLSPVIHEAAYKALGLDFSYERNNVSTGELSAFLSKQDFAGLSVTMPLKYEAFSMASKHSEESHKTSVVNTLVRTGEGFIGHNTDVAGFIEVFKQLEAPRAISLLGSGATARSAALALSRSFPKATIQVMARSKSSAEQIVHLARSFDLDAEHVAIDAQVVAGSDLVLSTLPGDVFGDVWKEVSDCKQNPAGVLIDVAYDPWPSRASTSWAGLSFSGLELLIWQAIEQVVLFAKAQGEQVEAKEDLYEVMKNSVSEYRADN